MASEDGAQDSLAAAPVECFTIGSAAFDDTTLSAASSSLNPSREARMPHLFDPPHLDTEAAYYAALDELDQLMSIDPDTPAGHRFDELLELIDDYESRCRPLRDAAG